LTKQAFFIFTSVKKTVFLLLFISHFVVYGQVFKGKVIDAKTKESLAFVNVVADNQKTGTTTDIDGVFILQDITQIKRLSFSYVGYEAKDFFISDIKDVTQTVVITLNKKSFELKEFIVSEKENPALIIIRKTIANRNKNNPEKLKSFKYNSYNKMFFTANVDSSALEDSTRFAQLDSSDQRMINFLKEKYIFLTESYTERSFKAPDRSYEKVLASRVSGFKNPVFSLLANQMQSFSFYNDYITLYEKKYLSPIADGSLSRYYYTIEDTLYQESDSIFIISYSPQPDKNIDGMKGLLYINTNGYAVQNVIAEPAKKEKAISIKIQQQYAFINNTAWFPVQLNTDILFYFIMLNNSPAVGIARSYIENIELLPEIKNSVFSDVTVEIDKNAGKREEDFWKEKRKDSLTVKEEKTYQFVDSVGKANNLDRKLLLFETFMSGKIPLGLIDIDLKHLFTYNDYEGIRLGLGIESSQRFSKTLSIGAYGAYGFKDKAFKYGAHSSVNIYARKEIKLGAAYSMDIIESGVQTFINDRKMTLSEAYRPYLIQRMDSLEKKEAYFSFRALKYAKFQIGINEQYRTTTNDYIYGITSNNITTGSRSFHFSEITASLKYIFREKFLQTPNYRISMGSDYPLFWLQYAKGINTFLNGDFNYHKLDLKIEKSFDWTYFGKTYVQLAAGHIIGELPYTLLYNGRGSNTIISGTGVLGLSVANTFETMGVNEFVSSSYGAIYFSHNFGKLLYQKGKFKPELIVVNNMMWGTLNNKDSHYNIAIKTPENGYYESGLIINNIVKSGFSGIGFGTFYKYGPYSNPETKNNFAYKLSLTLSF
jgi:hypothetical protein